MRGWVGRSIEKLLLRNFENGMPSGKNKEVVWSPASQNDLHDIGDYAVTTHSAQKAEEFLILIHTKAEGLIELPLLWRVREDMGDIRLLPVAPYFICYRVHEGTIEIVRIIHEKRDIAALLSRPKV